MNRPQPVAADAMAISAEVGTEVESAKYNHQPQVSYIILEGYVILPLLYKHITI